MIKKGENMDLFPDYSRKMKRLKTYYLQVNNRKKQYFCSNNAIITKITQNNRNNPK